MNRPSTAGIVLVAVGAGLLLIGWTPELGDTVMEHLALAFGGITVLVGVALFVGRRSSPGEHWTPDAVEEGILVPQPGDDLLETGEPEIRGRFRQQVADVLLTNGSSPEEAETAIAEGTWTDNELAAGYLEARPPDKLPEDSVLDGQRAAVFEELATLRDRHE